ncbi:macro domain-containing protein [Enterovibrio makurazakiensis]|uniref:type II toxin-antitoxin system antitoxin DNA ADP-ribosyl glycohydrolase DarG n=1 Tax=Enterovibrio makurazakiensis TaxID=2910232 RepID=UPI003D1C745E
MIKYVKGDLFTDSADALVNTVNTVGVMGKGLAFQFKNIYPDNFEAYKLACKAKELRTGKMFVFEIKSSSPSRYVINFPTKEHWRGKSKIEYIENGLQDLVVVARQLSLKSVAIPALGAGLGGLPWSQVERQIKEILSSENSVEWRIYSPTGECKAQEKSQMTTGRAILLHAIDSYIRTTKKGKASELEVQAFVFMLSRKGIKLEGLIFDQFRDTPYSEVLHSYLKKVDGEFLYLSGASNSPNKTLITIEKKSFIDLKPYVDKKPEYKNIIKNSLAALSGYEGQEGLALLSTSLWLANKQSELGSNYSDEQLADLILDNMPNARAYSKGMVKGAIKRLSEDNWLL